MKKITHIQIVKHTFHIVGAPLNECLTNPHRDKFEQRVCTLNCICCWMMLDTHTNRPIGYEIERKFYSFHI